MKENLVLLTRWPKFLRLPYLAYQKTTRPKTRQKLSPRDNAATKITIKSDEKPNLKTTTGFKVTLHSKLFACVCFG